ncbi:MAG: hypothetical protein LBL83_07115, partial [Clostridiales bacterium]|nr:hypothetical protein [Clostridiales bacterium]
MNSDLLGELRRALEKMDEAGEFDGRFVVLFGANHPGDFAIRFLRERGASVRSVIDSNALNAGKALEGVAIGLPESVMLPFRDDALVLICSRHYAEMRGQLERMGYGPRHVRKLLDMGPQKADGGGAGAEAFEKAAARAAEGFSVYAALKAKYGEGARILITPVRSIGDAYAACA